jgi:hypothetical protein
MAREKSKSVCTACTSYNCGNCRIGVAFADNLITLEQAQKFAKEGDVTMTKSVTGRLNAPSHRERHFVPLYAGRMNNFDRECACCGVMAESGEGHLAKISSDDKNWYVLCKACKKTGGVIKVLKSGAMTRELNAYGDIIKAGESFWESNKHPEKRGDMIEQLPTPDITPTFEVIQSLFAKASELMYMQMHPMMIVDPKSVRPGAGLDELYLGAKHSGKLKSPHNPSDGPPHHVRGYHAEKVILDDPHASSDAPAGWRRVSADDTFVKRFYASEKPVHRAAAAPGFLWADGPSAVSERGSMLGAGWGALPPSTERKHRTKRPKRVGW